MPPGAQVIVLKESALLIFYCNCPKQILCWYHIVAMQVFSLWFLLVCLGFFCLLCGCLKYLFSFEQEHSAWWSAIAVILNCNDRPAGSQNCTLMVKHKSYSRVIWSLKEDSTNTFVKVHLLCESYYIVPCVGSVTEQKLCVCRLFVFVLL
jgi:hypothetical protein